MARIPAEPIVRDTTKWQEGQMPYVAVEPGYKITYDNDMTGAYRDTTMSDETFWDLIDQLKSAHEHRNHSTAGDMGRRVSSRVIRAYKRAYNAYSQRLIKALQSRGMLRGAVYDTRRAIASHLIGMGRCAYHLIINGGEIDAALSVCIETGAFDDLRRAFNLS